MSAANEEVLVFPAEVLEPYLPLFQGGMLTDEKIVSTLLNQALDPLTAGYVLREDAEGDSSYKQIIPYCVLWRGRMVFRYKRSKKSGEARLHDLWSIGVGGHINPPDGGSGKETYENALYRELEEEVGLVGKPAAPVMGLIYDPSNDVGKVHLGVVHFIQLGMRPSLALRDEALASSEFHHAIDLGRDVYESWSKIVIDNLF